MHTQLMHFMAQRKLTQCCKATMLLLLQLYLSENINPISSRNIPGISLLPPSPANKALAIDTRGGGAAGPLTSWSSNSQYCKFHSSDMVLTQA